MKFGQVIGYNKAIFFFKNHAENDAGRLSFFLWFKKALYEAKASGLLSWEREELLRWNKKHFSSFLKDFHLPKIVSYLRVLP